MNDASKLNHLYFERQVEEMAACKGRNNETQKDRILNWIQEEGAVFCNDPIAKDRLATAIVPVAMLFPDLVAKLATIYLYNMGEQRNEELRQSDGMSWKYCDERTGNVSYAIGISVEGLEAGAEYVQFLLLHELAHVATDSDHTTAFHYQLNEMIQKFNAETGATITNDLFGWPSRHDCRRQTIPLTRISCEAHR